MTLLQIYWRALGYLAADRKRVALICSANVALAIIAILEPIMFGRVIDAISERGSVFATLNHLLWADRIWMSRLAGTAKPAGGIPESVSLHTDWADLKHERSAFDAAMIEWADRLDPAALNGELTYYSGAIKAEVRKPRWLLVTHMFNHQTHHRGQVHCMLTQAGGKPGDTDLPFMPMA